MSPITEKIITPSVFEILKIPLVDYFYGQLESFHKRDVVQAIQRWWHLDEYFFWSPQVYSGAQSFGIVFIYQNSPNIFMK